VTRNGFVAGALLLVLLGCGKYGPPTRTKAAPEKAPTSSAIPADNEEEEQKNPL
jgi:predicted small lipoprotein YifL